jgi:hypothetical protein
MNHPKLTILWNIAAKKLAVLLLIAGTAVASSAALGDGNKSSNPDLPKNSALLSGRTFSSNTFSLKSGYTYRGNRVFAAPAASQYINLNTVVTLQKGNTTYIVPLKKKVILDKVKIEFGNRQLSRN